MEGLIETFRIDIRLLLAQVVNFAIVVAVLWFFALKPLIKVMNDRSAKIEKSLEEAKQIESRHTESTQKAEQVITDAKKQTRILLEQAKQDAQARKKEMLNEAKKEIENLAAQSKKEIADEKEQMMRELKGEVAELVTDATKKVLFKTINTKVDSQVINEAIKDIS